MLFRSVTALAFLYFKKKKVDFAIIEVGLGGRLDATNIITPELSVITNISFDHKKHLGDTIEKIAFEKAGIIKPSIPLVTSEDGKGLEVFKKTCKKNKSKIYIAKTKKVKTSLKGTFQYQNASLALKVIGLLGNKVSKKAIKQGLMSAKWPGRLDYISKNVVFDCAHNPEAAKALAKDIKKLKHENIYLILGIMKDKDVKNMCKTLEPVAKEIIITKPDIERAEDPHKIAKFIKKKVTIINNVNNALEYAKLKANKKDLVVLTGSIFTVGEAFSHLRLEPFNASIH